MERYSARYGVNIHGWCLMHNHGHWIFEASSEDSISNLMRDMQSNYSRYVNRRYQKEPWKLLAPLTLYGRRARSLLTGGRGLSTGLRVLMRCSWRALDISIFCGMWRTIRCGRIWRGRRRIGRGPALGRIARVRTLAECFASMFGVIYSAIRR